MFAMNTTSERRKCVFFNAVNKQSGIGLVVDTLFGNFAHLHSLADFQNVSIPTSYTIQLRYINYVDMQSYQTMQQL